MIDSIQTMYDPVVSSSPGSVAQIRESATVLTQVRQFVVLLGAEFLQSRFWAFFLMGSGLSQVPRSWQSDLR